MAITAAYTVGQTPGLPSVVTLIDTHTGTDGTITKRRVFLRKHDGTYLVPSGTTTDYIEWDDFPATATIDIDALDKDYAFDITVQWLNSSNTVVNTLTQSSVLCYRYAKDYYIFLVKAQSSDERLVNHSNFYANISKMISLIDNAETACEEASDISSAQLALNKIKTLIDNPSNFL